MAIFAYGRLKRLASNQYRLRSGDYYPHYHSNERGRPWIGCQATEDGQFQCPQSNYIETMFILQAEREGPEIRSMSCLYYTRTRPSFDISKQVRKGLKISYNTEKSFILKSFRMYSVFFDIFLTTLCDDFI